MSLVNAWYDAVVIGDGLPLLSSGLVLAKGGARTLLISLDRQEQAAEPPLPHSSSPYVEGVHLPALLRQLGLNPADLRTLIPVEPAWQLILPGQRN